MKVVILQDDLFGYLQYVVKRFANDGIDPNEGLALYHLNQAIASAKTVDDGHLAKIQTGEVGDIPVASVTVEG